MLYSLKLVEGKDRAKELVRPYFEALLGHIQW